MLPGFGNRTPASTLNFLLWLMILSIIVFITITMITSAIPKCDLDARILQRACQNYKNHIPRMLYFLANMLFKTCPSSVQALSKPVQTPHFYVQAWEIRLQKYCNLQHGLVQAFRPTGLFIILKGRTTPMPVLRGLRLLDDTRKSHRV